jgi:adenine phosphoribosyltransferase
MSTLTIESRVASAVRRIPDFPKKGIEFIDVTRIFLDVQLTQDLVEQFAKAAKEVNVTAIAALETRGFYLGLLIAQRLKVPFIPIRKRARLPNSTAIHSTYDLEYGSSTLEFTKEDLPEDSKIMIHDDLLATGSTAAAAARLLQNAGAEITMFSFIGHIEDLNGAEHISSFTENIFTITDL